MSYHNMAWHIGHYFSVKSSYTQYSSTISWVFTAFFLDLLKTYSSCIKSLLTLGDDTTYTSYTHDPKLTSDISHGKPAGN